MCPLNERFKDSIGLSNTTELKCTKILLKSLREQFRTNVILKEDHNDSQTNEKIATCHRTAPHRKIRNEPEEYQAACGPEKSKRK